MKHLLPIPTRSGFTPLILLCMMLTSHITSAQEQQQSISTNDNNVYNNINVSGNQLLNNKNTNTLLPTGPNGMGSYRAININVPVIDNGTGQSMGGPNVRGFTSSVIPKQTVNNQTANKPKVTRPAVVSTTRPKPVTVASTVQRPKPKPTTTAPRRTVTRSVAPVVVAPTVAAPVVAAQVQTQVPVSNPPIQLNNNAPRVVEQVMNDDQVIVQTNVMVNTVSAPVISTASAPAVRSAAVSSGSGSSGKSHRSGRKKHSSFYYKANKKMGKLFAKSKKGKFDPAKCFVWK